MMPGNAPAGLARVHKPIIVQFERNLVVVIACTKYVSVKPA